MYVSSKVWMCLSRKQWTTLFNRLRGSLIKSSIFLSSPFPHQRGADTLRADTTDRWVCVCGCLWFDRTLVIDGRSCKSRLWSHSIRRVLLLLLLQVLRLRKLRSGLHEEGRRPDAAMGLTVYPFFFWFTRFLNNAVFLVHLDYDSNPVIMKQQRLQL